MTPERLDGTPVADLARQFVEVGVVALYGGGPESKGHGFWLYQTADPQDAIDYWKKRGWCEIPGETIKNDGKRSGNDCFWMFEDAEKLYAQMTISAMRDQEAQP